MTFLNGKLQGVVAGMLAELASQAVVPRLYVGRIDDCATNTRLHDYHIDVGTLQFVEYGAKFLFLSLNAVGIGGFGTRPVDASNGG